MVKKLQSGCHPKDPVQAKSCQYIHSEVLLDLEAQRLWEDLPELFLINVEIGHS